ncbi:MAG: PAS domain S-box protein, partial [Phycisphaeraceae bacterium]|nr:PAS domain S-box protein [Phycisphaeraceae bacterium]
MVDKSCQSKSQDVLKISLGKIYLIIALAVAVIAVCLGYVYWAGNEMVARQAPQARALIQLQLDTTLAHLWFEEIISEDSDINLDDILAHLDQAQACTHALLNGGDSCVGKILPLRDDQTRKHTEQLQSQLTAFERMTLERWENKAASGIGSPLDQTYDQAFHRLLDQAHTVQEDLGGVSEHQLKVLKTIQLSLMGVCLVTALSVGSLVTGLVARQRHNRQALLAANQQLEASNQQLQASEQQLRAANQQLEASNQQLEASDQQMRAVNQQLIASEQQVRAERDKAQRYFSLAGTMLVVLDPDGCVERINRKGCELIGAAEHEIVGKDWFGHFLPEPMQAPVRDVFDQLVAGEGEPVEFYENPMQIANGEQRLIAWHNALLQDDKGSIVGILSSGEDITDRRQAEKEIQTFKKALDSSSDAIGMSTPQGRHIYQNHTFDTLFGDIGEDPPASIYVNEDIGRDVFESVMGGHEWTGEVAMVGKNKGVLNILLRAYPVKEEGRIIALVGVHTDITQRIQAEASLRESQQRLHQLIDAAPYGAMEYELCPDDRLVFVGYNQAANRILDTDCARFMGKTIEEAFPPLAQTPIPAAYRRAAATGERYEDEQVAYSHDQITGAFEISAFQTGPQRMAVFFRDITERKRATEALEKERNLIVQLMETSPVGIIMTDAAGQIRFANSPAEQILGLTTDEIMGRTYNDSRWHITDYEGNPFADEHLPFSQVMDKLEPVYGVRHAIEWPDGRRTLLSINATPLLNQNEQFTGMVGSVEDVTKRVQAEKRVLQYQSQLRALVSQLTLSEERERKRLAVE